MRRRARLLTALAFALLFALLPGPGPGGGPYLGYLAVRGWLLDWRGSPLAPWAEAGLAPRLQVDLAQSPAPASDADRLRLASLADEWVLGLGAGAQALAPWPAHTPPVALVVRIGDRGVRAELQRPDGTFVRFERPLPDRWSLLPAALAIVLAILLQRVLPALLLAGFCGSAAVVFGQLAPPGLGAGLLASAEHFVVDCLWRRALWEDFYLRITVFVLLLFAAIAIVRDGGGFAGLVALLQRRVRGPVGAQLASFATGCVLLFDDYTNCLVTGTAMRPLCDAVRVSRAKLAYLVDSTAAPIAGVSLASTWVAYETSQYRAPLAMIAREDGTPYRSDDAMAVFLASMPYRYYCWFALLLVVVVILSRRDLGPMWRSEAAARTAGPSTAASQPAAGSPAGPARLAIVPLTALVALAGGLLLTGWPNDLALPLAAAVALLLAVGFALALRRLHGLALLRSVLGAWRSLLLPMLVLFLAWTLGHVTHDLATSHYLAAAARTYLLPAALPIVLFLLAALIAFATGTSFGTMAILLPNVVLLAYEVGQAGAGAGGLGSDLLLLLCLAAVLEGSIFGDHASPISDTTLLSSLSSGCDHVEHVVTQLPYALLALLTSVLFGYLPIVWFGPAAWLPGLALGGLAMLLVVRCLGRPLPAALPR